MTTTSFTGNLIGDKRDAYNAVFATLKLYGLESLADNVFYMVQNGLGADSIWIELQNSTVWKQRFRGNEIRRQRGAAVLSPAEYLSTESAYRQVMRQFGLPTGFWNTPDDLAKFIGADVSPMELQGRLEVYRDVVQNGALTGVWSYAQQKFGITTGDAIAYWIEPFRALPLIQQQAQASQIGAAAARVGFGDLDVNTALRLAGIGVTGQAAQEGFGQAATMLELTRELPGQNEDPISKGQLTGALLEGKGPDVQAVKTAQERRKAPFQAGGGARATEEGFEGLGKATT